MKAVATVLTLLVLATLANAQTAITSFPYTYDWTGAGAFTKGSGAEYIGGDGHWATYAVGNKPDWAPDGTATCVITNAKNTDDPLFCSVDATGRTFTGAEVFTFDAKRSGGSVGGSLTVQIGGTTLLTLNVATLTTSFQPFSVAIPVSLSNSIFAITITVNTDGVVSIDNPNIHGGALPITLSSFKLDLSSAAPVLTWKTISEIDNYGFYVQKSQDMTTWTEIANSFQAGYGTTTVEHDYTFTDNTLPVGKFYRLHQVDLDGTSHYSDAISVVSAVEPAQVVKEFALGQNWPNPFNPVTAIKYTVGGTGSQGPGAGEVGTRGGKDGTRDWGLGTRNVRLVVYDVLGRQVATLVDEVKAPGSYEVRFDGSGLASGVYIYRLTSGSFAETRTMLLMK